MGKNISKPDGIATMYCCIRDQHKGWYITKTLLEGYKYYSVLVELPNKHPKDYQLILAEDEQGKRILGYADMTNGFLLRRGVPPIIADFLRLE